MKEFCCTYLPNIDQAYSVSIGLWEGTQAGPVVATRMRAMRSIATLPYADPRGAVTQTDEKKHGPLLG